jgi:hypothetical protein
MICCFPVAGIAGVFLYVALVSMMAELAGPQDACALGTNVAAMTVGAIILLLVGLYEHDLIAVFE